MRPIDADALLEGEKEWSKDAGFYTPIYEGFKKRIKAAPTIELTPKWISVKDRLPEEGEKVLVRGIKGGIQAGVFRGLSAPSRERMWHWKKNTCLEVVCWMSQKSLPEPPKEV